MQLWPACPKAPRTIAWAARSMSPVSSTITAALAPSSRVHRLRPASACKRHPTTSEPVNESFATRGSVASASASAPRAGRTEKAPAGRPAPASASPMASALEGVRDAGLSTKGQPATPTGNRRRRERGHRGPSVRCVFERSLDGGDRCSGDRREERSVRLVEDVEWPGVIGRGGEAAQEERMHASSQLTCPPVSAQAERGGMRTDRVPGGKKPPGLAGNEALGAGRRSGETGRLPRNPGDRNPLMRRICAPRPARQ